MPGPVQSARRRRGVREAAAMEGRCYPETARFLLRAGPGLLGRGALRRRLLGRRLPGRRLLRAVGAAGAVAAPVALAHGVEARLERGHEVGHRGAHLLAERLHRDLLAGGLALDERHDLVAVGVVVLAGVE